MSIDNLPDENSDQAIREKFLKAISISGEFSDSTFDLNDVLKDIFDLRSDTISIYETLLKDVYNNPQNYDNYPLALKHLLYKELEAINMKVLQEFKRANDNGTIPNLLHTKEIAEARESIEKFGSALSKKDLNDVIDVFHLKYSESDNDFLLEIQSA